MIMVASLFGAFSPFCSCGVIPLIAALLSIGVPVAAVMAVLAVFTADGSIHVYSYPGHVRVTLRHC